MVHSNTPPQTTPLIQHELAAFQESCCTVQRFRENVVFLFHDSAAKLTPPPKKREKREENEEIAINDVKPFKRNQIKLI